MKYSHARARTFAHSRLLKPCTGDGMGVEIFKGERDYFSDCFQCVVNCLESSVPSRLHC